MADLSAQLRRHPFCAGLAPEHVEALASCASDVAYAPGQLLAREGTDADATFLVTAGRVALCTGSDIVETVEAGELLGWSWLIDGTCWHLDAVAHSAVRALRLDGDTLDARMHADPVFGHALARHVLRTVHGRLERARMRSLDVFGAPS